MPDFSKRSDVIEVMDDLNCSGPVVDQTLTELEFINKWLGGNNVTLNGLKKLLPSCTPPLKIADLGCGGGDMLKLISDQLRSMNISAQLTGIDANPNIVSYAQQNVKSYPEINVKALDIFSTEFRQEKFDLVFATLFFHHFTHEQLVDLFKHLYHSTQRGIVVNDLHRHAVAYYSIKWLTQLFSKSSMVINDAPLSVQRGFSRSELVEILNESGIKSYSLKWKWAFRWQLIIHSNK